MKFIHMADMHFDAPFTVLNNRSGLGDIRRIEQREIFKKVIDKIKLERIPYFFISGDLYEHEYIKKTTIEYINELFKTIPDTQIFISPGNHDPFTKNSYYNNFIWNDNVHIFKNKIEKYEDNEIIIYGYGFTDFTCKDFETQNIKIEKPEKINILIMHASLDSSDTIEQAYNPVKSKELSKIGFDYIALGHIHKANYQEEDNILYPGSTVSLGFDELGEHGVIQAEITKEKKDIRFIKMDNRVFNEKELDITEIYSEEELVEKINELEILQNEMIKLILIGNNNFEINKSNILKLINNKNIIKIKDCTEIKYNLEEISKENTLRGIFVKDLLKKLETEDDKEIIQKAIEIGLKAIEE